MVNQSPRLSSKEYSVHVCFFFCQEVMFLPFIIFLFWFTQFVAVVFPPLVPPPPPLHPSGRNILSSPQTNVTKASNCNDNIFNVLFQITGLFKAAWHLISFQIRVRVIEGRQLPGSNIHPVVRVTVNGQQRETTVKKSTNKPVYNQVSFLSSHP